MRDKSRVMGEVVRLMSDKGFGFIKSEDGLEYFFHRSSVHGGWEGMQVGDHVSFYPTTGQKGLRAEEVAPE